MQAVFKYKLDQNEQEKVKIFCNSVDYCSIDQYFGFSKFLPNTKICYFLLIEESQILSFCQISESFRSAHINFGPVCCNEEIMVVSIKEIINYYEKRNFYYMGIQMYFKSGFETDYIEYQINKLYKVSYVFDNNNTKSSIEIDLDRSIEDIFSNFRKGHKSDIKKALKLGLTVEQASTRDELDSFFQIYLKMCHARNISERGLTQNNIFDFYNFLKENNRGNILIVKDNTGLVIGGAILAYQGKTVRYFKGAADPDKRDLPISHIVLYEAIVKAKADNFKFFDFWGYNHFADQNDPVYNINHFKKGFGGYYSFFAKKMNINLVPKGYNIYLSLLWIKKVLLKIRLLK
jgi:hypothetical protein